MADYDAVSTLSALGAKTGPTGSTPGNLYKDYIQQLKGFLETFLAVSMADGGALKGNAVTESVINDGAITTNKIANLAVTAGKIANGTITATQIAAGTITATQIATGTITATQLAANAVTTTQITDLAVTSGKIANNGVTATQLASNAVETAKILNGAVTADKIGTGAVTYDKLPTATEAFILVHNASGVPTAVAMSGAATIDKDGVVSLSAVSSSTVQQCLAQEVKATTVAAGANTGASWQSRGNVATTAAWSASVSCASVEVKTDGEIWFKQNGVYLVRATAPAYSVGKHRLRINTQSSSATYVQHYGAVGVALNGIQSYVTAEVLVTISGIDDTTTERKLKVEHWTQTTKSVNGFGAPSSSGENEIYASVHIVRVI